MDRETKAALANLRKCAKLAQKMRDLQAQLSDLEADQFTFSEAAFQQAQQLFEASEADL